jgi:hypothetical protein
MMKIYIAMAAAYILHSPFALADYQDCSGPIEYRQVLSSSTTYTSDTCKKAVALKLTQGDHQFSFGNYEAEYWDGQYQRPAEKTEMIRHDTYNCWGTLLYSETIVKKTTFQIAFNIENPNLRNDASWIDIKAPMTDDEAEAAFLKAKHVCETSSV